MSLLGIDVSHYNGEVDWFSVSDSDVKFAFAKATEGTSMVDDRFANNWKGMGDAGLLRGAYHFARPGGDPEAQCSRIAEPLAMDREVRVESAGGAPHLDPVGHLAVHGR